MAHVRRLKRGLNTPGKHELPKFTNEVQHLAKVLERYLAGLGQLVDRV